MNRTRHGSAAGLAVVVLLVLGLHGLAAAGPPTLESFAGVIGGVPTNGALIPGPCSTYGGAPALAFFIGGGGLSVPVGGIANCGYSGDMTDVTATAGPLPATQSLAPVLLGNPGFTGEYSGDAQAIATFGTLGAMADGTVTAPAGNPLALANSAAAAFFSDTLTPTSPLVPNGSVGSIRYVFHVSGSASTPKPLAPFEPGTASAELAIQHNGGSPFPLVRVSSTRGSNGFIISQDGNTAGFVSGLGSIAGAGTFTSAFNDIFGAHDIGIIWGQPIDFRAGLLVYVGGDGVSDFLTAAQLVDVLLFDANHNPVTTFTLASASGTSYGSCTFGITPTAQSFGSAGGTGSVSVTAPGGCPWSASSNDGFITVTSGASGSGDDTVAYSVGPNPGAARQGTLTVAGQTFTVSQDSGCAFSITPSSANFPSGGGTGSVTLSTAPGCAWTAVSNDTFITVTSGAGGTGSGTVGYSVDPNNGPQRGGTLTIADQTFTVTQDSGCSYSIAPTSAHVGAAGGTGNVLVATANGCAWTAASNDDFIEVTSGASGSGQGAVGYSVQANPTSGRHGGLTIAGQTFTITQDGAVAVNTPAGSGVSVPLLGGGIRVLFSEVTQGGVTTAIPTDPCQPGDPCRAFTQYRVLRGLNFGVSTSAAFTGPVTLTFDLTKIPPDSVTPPNPIVPPSPIVPPNPITPPNPVTPPSPITPPSPVTPQFFSTLRVLHGEGGTLTDRTVLTPGDPCRPNDAAQTICATVTSLSPFALVQLAPYDVLVSALGDLLAVRQATTDRRQSRELDAAIEALDDALDASLWIDTFHLRGDDVFDDTRRAVGKLTAWLSDASVQRIVDQILGADRELARTAVEDAVAAGGRARKLADAHDDIIEGDGQVVRTAYTGAIKRYKDAWQDAGEARR